MKTYLKLTPTVVLLVFVSCYGYGQQVYHFPKEENFQVYSDCFDELREIKNKAEERTLQYEADVEEYKKGRFCSDCKRTARQIERELHVSFDDHIEEGRRHGRQQIAATKAMYDELYRKYLADWNPLKKAYESKFMDCQGKVKVSINEANEAIKTYNTNYTQAVTNLAKIKDPQKKAALQQKLNSINNTFKQYQQQVQQQVTQRSGDTQQTIAKLNKQNDDVLNLMNDIAIVTPTGKNYANAVAGQPAKTLNNTTKQVTATPRPAFGTTSSNSNTGATAQQTQLQNETQAQIDAAKNETNPIMQATYLSQAKIKLAYEQAHGNNSATVQQLKQQIGELEKQQAAQNQADLQNSLNKLTGTTPVDPTENLMNLIETNSNLESQKSANKEDVKKSMGDFFSTLKFKKDTTKTKKDTLKIKAPAVKPQTHN